MVKVKIRGIYSTGLAKFLIEKGYELTFPSQKQKERFGIEIFSRADINIKDSADRRGIVIVGYEDCVKKLVEDLREIFWDSFFVEDIPGKIVKAKKVGEEGEYFVYQSEMGEIYVKKLENPKEEEYIQIKRYDGKKYYGTTKIVKPGTFLDIIKNSPNQIEFRVSKDKLQEYENLLKLIQREGWGIKLKYEAKLASFEDIIEEVQDLFAKDLKFYKIYFGLNSLVILDNFRSKVLETIDFHHMYRRNSLFSKFVDFSEILIKTCDRNCIRDALFRYSCNLIQEIGNIRRFHYRWYGLGFSKTEFVLEVNYDQKIKIKTKRYIFPGRKNIYDGLEIPIEPGDYAIAEYLFGAEYFRINYYNKEGKLKGSYININSPIEIVGNRIYYNDLEIDVVKVRDSVRIVDSDKLKELYDRKVITEKYYKHILDVVEHLKSEV